MIGKRQLLAGALEHSGCNRVLEHLPAWRGLVVLNYHRIGDPAACPFDRGLFSATDEQFADQVRHLTRHYDVIGIRDLDEASRDASGRFAMITFDDGYRDNYEAALPILRAYGAVATFFITSGFLDDGRVAWWDEIAWMVRGSDRDQLPASEWIDSPLELPSGNREPAIRQLLQVYKSLPSARTAAYLDYLAEATGSGRVPPERAAGVWMSWDMVRELHLTGMDIGGHTVNHPVLAHLSADEQLHELVEGKRRIEQEIGRPLQAFSYPVGQRESFTAVTQRCVREAGYRWAFSYYGGYGRPPLNNPLDLPRIPVEVHMPPAIFRSTLALPRLFA